MNALVADQVIVELQAKVGRYNQNVANAERRFGRSMRSIEASAVRAERRVSSAATGMARGLLGAFAGIAAIRGAQQLIDASTRIENSLKVAGVAGDELRQVYDRLFDSAQRNVAPIETLVELYSRASLVQKELGVTTEELLGFTDKVALALRVAGADAQSASGALLQLSQALGSGIVRAEEFNSILEGALPIAQAAAAGLEEAGGSVAKLRQLVVDGKISSEAFFRAFEAGSVILEEKVAGAELTVSQAFVRLQNVLIDAAGRFDDGSDASRRLADALAALATAIENVDFGPFINGVLDIIEHVGAGINTLIAFRDAVYDVARAFSEFTGGAAIGDALGLTRGDTEGRAQNAIQDRFDRAFAAAEKTGRLRRQPTDVGTVTRPDTVSLSDFPISGEGSGSGGRKGRRRQPFEREVEQIRERTAAIEAETEAQAGLNPLIDDYGFAVEKAAATQELLNAAERQGLEITPELRASIEHLATGYANAVVEAEKLAESQQNIRDIAEDFKGLAQDVLSGFINDLREGKSAAEALENALGKVADRLLDIFLSNLFGGGGGGGGFLDFLFNAKGNAFSGGRVTAFARGGVVNKPTIFPMANGMGLMGEAGPEAILPLKRGATGRLGVDASGAGGGGTVVNVIDNAGVDKRTERRRGPDGRAIVEIVLERVKEDYATGGFDSVNRTRYGTSPRTTTR